MVEHERGIKQHGDANEIYRRFRTRLMRLALHTVDSLSRERQLIFMTHDIQRGRP